MALRFFATAARGIEHLLAVELRGLGAADVRETRAGVSFAGDLAAAYRACLWSRLASRVLLPLARFAVNGPDDLYAGVRGVDWLAHLDESRTVAVSFTGTSRTIRDTMFGARRVKDAIVDQVREKRGGARPSVDTLRPDVRVFAHLARDEATVGVDLSGDSLHRRGYRRPGEQGAAPLKETLAAALLTHGGWPAIAAAGGAFVDPLCGSGTLPIEAALVAADVAPGLLRAERAARGTSAPRGFGLEGWAGHDAAAWRELLVEAAARREAGLARLAARRRSQPILGFDRDPRAVALARDCVRRAGLEGVVSIARAELAALEAPDAGPHAEAGASAGRSGGGGPDEGGPASAAAGAAPCDGSLASAAAGAAPLGLVAANLPYGRRLGGRDDLTALHALLGARLRSSFGGWRAVLLVGDRELAHAVGLRSRRPLHLRNGPLPCLALRIDVPPRAAALPEGEALQAPAAVPATGGPRAASVTHLPPPLDFGEPLANRLRRNLRHTGRAMRRQGITCYRLYDADLPEYNIAVDLYGGRVHVQEYAPPPEVDPARAARRLDEALSAVAAVLGVERSAIVVKQRRRQRGAAQYGRRAGGGALFPVTEDGLTYLVDLETYLDTGLFLDQRETRRLIRRLAGGRRFLNLFAYTATATVCAVAGGAPATTSVDLSATYLEWARRNLAANGVEDVSLELRGGEQWPPGSGARQGKRVPGGGARRHRSVPEHHGTPGPTAAHRLVQADCLRYIAETDGRFDLILLDPPSFSNSKRMGRATFDVQRDHADLIRMTARRLLAPRGVLLFACHLRGFKLDPSALPGLEVRDLSRATLAPDFARRANAHHVWRIEAR